jgi:hypothetical protein
MNILKKIGQKIIEVFRGHQKNDVIPPEIKAVIQSFDDKEVRRSIEKYLERLTADIQKLDSEKAKLTEKLQSIQPIELPDISKINESIARINALVSQCKTTSIKFSPYKPKSPDSFDAILKRNNLVNQFKQRENEKKKKEEETKKQVRATLEIERLEKSKQKLIAREREILLKRQQEDQKRREEEAKRLKEAEEKQDAVKANERILDKYNIKYLYHMTHKDNLDNILKNGLQSHNFARNNGLLKNDIADNEVNRRRTRPEPIYRRSVHDYVPFYFNPKNPMLYCRKNLQDNIVMLAIDRKLLFQNNALFTNGNAAADATHFYNNIQDLKMLNWNCIVAQSWADLPDGKRERCSETLVYPDVSIQSIQKIFCNNQHTLEFVKEKTNIEVEINNRLYF